MKTVAMHLSGNSKPTIAHKRLLDALGKVLGIRIETRQFGCNEGADAWILQEADRELLRSSANCTCPVYASICANELIPCEKSTTIEFSRNSGLTEILSGRRVYTDEAPSLKALPRWLQNTTTLCSKKGSPIWGMREIGNHQHHFVSIPIPGLNEDEPLFHHLNEKRFLHLLPLFLFLRSLTEDPCWTPPPLQASFMFDDPNLHWPTYGFINFAEIAKEAIDHKYHVSFATIPLDAWFIHKPTVWLFKKHKKQLSLLIHGNDHVHKEFGRSNSDRLISSSLAESLQRIAQFERRSGLTVSRIMAPPHGACREESIREMARLGFEAACVSRGSLEHYNSRAKWLLTVGMRPSENISGLTVFPRFRISSHCHNSIILAALLRQPIIPVGHHYDLAGGLEILRDLAEFINSLGEVQWGSLSQILRSHYSQRLNGKTLWIRMFSKRIQLSIPQEISQIHVERPWLEKEALGEPLGWRILDENSVLKAYHPDEAVAVLPGQQIEIVSDYLKLPTSHLKSRLKFRLWPLLRRQLTEMRDRSYPALRWISTRL